MANYKERKLEELRDIAKERDLSGRSGLNKDELAEALENYDEEQGVDDAAADNFEGGKNEEGGRGVAQEEGQDFTSRQDATEPSEKAQEEYQQEYLPSLEDEDKPAVGHDSPASDPDNPIVEENLKDREAYQEMTDEQRELSDLALDSSGPLVLTSPYERVMTGAVTEDQAKEQEKERAKLPDEFVGDLTERVRDEDAERAHNAFKAQEEQRQAPDPSEFEGIDLGLTRAEFEEQLGLKDLRREQAREREQAALDKEDL